MRTISRILCPVDLSDTSALALQHAALLAKWFNSAVTVLHIANPVVVPATDWSQPPAGMPPMLTGEEKHELLAEIDKLAASAGLPHVEVIVEHGRPAKQILERARIMPAELIVIGTHGVGGFEYLVLGSVAEKVLRQANCPVLTIPPRAHATSSLPFKQILCPVDFSESARAACDVALSLADGRAELTVLHALEWPSDAFEPFTPEYRREQEERAARELQEWIPKGMGHPPRIQLAPGKAYREILRVAAEAHADLIVMGVQGRNALDLMLFGSTTNQVVRRATCPVLTLRT
jgi:nucleotide-binding universal stress UspA family protein